MVMASNNEIAFNSAINCWGPNATLYPFDFDLNPVPCGDAPDIGAFEYCLEI